MDFFAQGPSRSPRVGEQGNLFGNIMGKHERHDQTSDDDNGDQEDRNPMDEDSSPIAPASYRSRPIVSMIKPTLSRGTNINPMNTRVRRFEGIIKMLNVEC